MDKETKVLEAVLAGLMEHYKTGVPVVGKIIDQMIAEKLIESEDWIENDHIAFRTLGVPHLGVQSLEKIFLHLGYTKREHYHFAEKKLDAWWYAPPNPKYPRIFISELRVNDLSASLQALIKKYTHHIPSDPVDHLDLNDPKAIDAFLHSSLWALPTHEDYVSAAAESEYAAWVLYNRYYLNHFTISVHNLPEGYNTIESFNQFLERNQIVLNDAGGKIKISKDGLLKQSATVAAMVSAEFTDGVTANVSGSYVEFAERKIIEGAQRREGFETSNADKIFESTYSTQTAKLEKI